MNKEQLILPNKQLGKLVVALYSTEQDCFHLETIHEYLTNNIQCAMFKKYNDFKMIGIFNSDIQGDKYIETFREFQKQANDISVQILIDKALKVNK